MVGKKTPTRKTGGSGSGRTRTSDDDKNDYIDEVEDNREEDNGDMSNALSSPQSDAVVVQTKTSDSAASRTRSQRKRQEQALRSKATGLGLSISVDQQSRQTNKKLVFDDAVDEPESHLEEEDVISNDKEEKEEDDMGRNHKENDDDDGDDDDAVEEIKTSVAKEQQKEQRVMERDARVHGDVTAKSKTRKRKRKLILSKKSEGDGEDSDDSDDDDVIVPEKDFDESFFSQLDAEMDAEREKKKRIALNLIKQPKRTTFVVEGDDDISKPKSVQTDHNIEVVVLGKKPTGMESSSADRSLTATAVPTDMVAASFVAVADGGTALNDVSDAALVYSRSKLVSGTELMSPKQRQKAEQRGAKNPTKTTGWRRSKKVNRLLTGGMRRKNPSDVVGPTPTTFVAE